MTGVDGGKREVILTDRSIPYDILVVATGSHYNYFDHPNWQPLAPCLKTIPDALEIRSRVLLSFELAEHEPDQAAREALLTIVIVGGGPTGVELAGTIAELAKKTLSRDFRHIEPGSARVILVEAGQRILNAFPDKLAVAARRRLQALGVDVREGKRVGEIDSNGAQVDGQRIQAKTVLWAAGVLATPVAKWLGVEADRSGRVKVTPSLALPSDERIYILGDAALVTPEGGKPLPGLAPVATQEGAYAGRHILDRLGPDGTIRPVAESRPFRNRNMGNLATVGRGFAIADLGPIKTAGFAAWVLWVFVHIWYLIGFRNKLTVMIEWLWAFVTYVRGARLITRP